MGARRASVKSISRLQYAAFVLARRIILTKLERWLETEPNENLATAELMITMAALRDVHDRVTGRKVLGSVAENAGTLAETQC
jgi:hypothetical protein